MSCVGHGAQARARDRVREACGAVEGDPGVLLAPDDVDRQLDIGEPIFDFRGEAFVGLGDLAIERPLALVGDPWCGQLAKLIWAEASMTGGLDVGGQRAGVDRRRERGEDLGVVMDEAEER